MVKYTPHTLKKIESIFKESGYTVRYGTGNFTAGYAIVKDKQVVVINKFFDTESRVHHLIDILTQIDIVEVNLSEESIRFLQKLSKSNAA